MRIVCLAFHGYSILLRLIVSFATRHYSKFEFARVLVTDSLGDIYFNNFAGSEIVSTFL